MASLVQDLEEYSNSTFFLISEFHKTEGQKKKKILKLQNEFSNLNEESLYQFSFWMGYMGGGWW